MQPNQPKVQVLSTKIKAKINLTADDWQFYNVSGRNLAARRLNRSVEKMLAKGEIENLGSALSPFARWGACDTEGYYMLGEILRSVGLSENRFY